VSVSMPVSVADSVTERSAESIMRRFWEDFYSQSDLAAGQEIMVPSLYQHTSEFLKLVHVAFPDARWVINYMITDGPTVVTRYTWSGTHLGAMGNLAPTGKKITMNCVMIHHVKDGKIQDEEDGVLDLLSFYQQLGVVPSELPWV
jgi:predicted ester cyclase